ncbi:hypothetical protein [Neopusillimonas aromaticivorans]|jgi:hypothetical protein|nr:hypothetical protein [Neopusillimonas aromaticivorans]WJJ94167.1 hypothetical protein N7E01_03425 [Neopusillimonas aromaticivorans]
MVDPVICKKSDFSPEEEVTGGLLVAAYEPLLDADEAISIDVFIRYI